MPHFNLGNFSFSPSYIQAGAIILLVFVLLLSLAQLRSHFVNWSFKGAVFGLFFGFLLAVALLGFLVVGWKKTPQSIADILDIGRSKLTQVLGIQVLGIKDEVPKSVVKDLPTISGAIDFFQALTPAEAAKVKKIICQP
jgi:protein-S-isoprenylcysteine O-methyltransferase Ste14